MARGLKLYRSGDGEMRCTVLVPVQLTERQAEMLLNIYQKVEHRDLVQLTGQQKLKRMLRDFLEKHCAEMLERRPV